MNEMSYVVAVSGGVDSVTLLDMLLSGELPGLLLTKEQLVVAHFNHGIRPDSHVDAKIVEKQAAKYGLRFECEQGNLGSEASEAQARQARYKFLRSVRNKYNAKGIITAHHQDDLVETMIINLVRGTGWRGLISLGSNSEILRPLLNIPKSELLSYAKAHKLVWREDSTNQDQVYLRNYIRHSVIPRLIKKDPHASQQFLDIYTQTQSLENNIATELQKLLPTMEDKTKLPRYQLIMLPPSIAQECIYHLLRQLDSDWHPTKKHIVRVLHFAKTAEANKLLGISKRLSIMTTRRQLLFQRH